MESTAAPHERATLAEATVRFCGDSGDGMQLTGAQFTRTTGIAGNDLMTFPDFPAEIRAPAGTLAGVSGFQIHFSSNQIFTPGDEVDVLVAMNPAALKANLADLKPHGILILNTDSFDKKNLARVNYEVNPVEDPDLANRYRVHAVPITKLTRNALEGLDMPQNQIDRSKNFFALGMAYWLFDRDLSATREWIDAKFKNKPTLIEANTRSLKAGYNYCETAEVFHEQFEIDKAKLAPGLYRNITGNAGLGLGLVTASQKAGLGIVLGSYPITPASDVLHQLSQYKNFGVKTVQAEDEIAAIGAAIGASFGGAIGVTTTSGPGMCLKLEAMGLAVMVELPLLIVNIQRAGPSTGMPTKTEQTDLLQAMYGRNGESPIVVVSAARPADAFDAALDALRIALEFMTPVVLLSDAYIANGSEPWKLPELDSIPPIKHRKPGDNFDKQNFHPYARDPETMARAWATPGIPGLEHRIGGLEKDSLTGNVSYDPANHQKMTDTRAAKIAGIANFVPEQEVFGDPDGGDLLVLGWGSTFGAIRAAVTNCRAAGKSVSHAHLRFLNPFPRNLESLLGKFKKVLIPELNMGQLSLLIQGKFAMQVEQLHKVQGRPFLVHEIIRKIDEIL